MQLVFLFSFVYNWGNSNLRTTFAVFYYYERLMKPLFCLFLNARLYLYHSDRQDTQPLFLNLALSH